MESLIFLVKKRSGKIKSRTVANSRTKIAYINREHAVSPTSASDAIIITGVIEAKPGRDVMINDVPNDFVQTLVPQDKEDERISMNI